MDEQAQSLAPLTVNVAERLREVAERVPAGATFSISPSAELCSALELLLPRLLRRRYAEWAIESLDGFFVARATRTHACSFNIAGTCILISDQTVTPFMLDVDVDAATLTPHVERLRLKLGERGDGPLGISGPPCNSADARLLLQELPQRANLIAWVYEVDHNYSDRSSLD